MPTELDFQPDIASHGVLSESQALGTKSKTTHH